MHGYYDDMQGLEQTLLLITIGGCDLIGLSYAISVIVYLEGVRTSMTIYHIQISPFSSHALSRPMSVTSPQLFQLS